MNQFEIHNIIFNKIKNMSHPGNDAYFEAKEEFLQELTEEDVKKELESEDQKLQDANDIWKQLTTEQKLDLLRSGGFEI